MKCPECGKWNQASNPHCRYCGAALEPEGDAPAWQKQLDDKAKPKAYIRVDETGFAEATEDARDTLAGEMADLKRRKLSGESRRREWQEQAANQSYRSRSRVRTTTNQQSFFQLPQEEEGNGEPPERGETFQVPPLEQQPRYRTTYEREDLYGYGTGRRIVSTQMPEESEAIYDGYHDTSWYEPYNGTRKQPVSHGVKRKMPRSGNHSGTVRAVLLTVLIMSLLGVALYLVWTGRTESQETTAKASVMMTIDENDLTAHTITIPGEDGQRITIRELRTSAIVTGGVATFVIPDHLWYDDSEDFLQETMRVTLSPYLVGDNGKQTALDQIQYDIDIPLSTISLESPSSLYQVVSTTLYNIIFYVQEGSSVTINGEDYSDLVGASGGKVSYNASVQPVGENVIEIKVRSQYCRENTMVITLYREVQDIPLDLASDIATSTSNATGTITVRGTTLPGAVVKVLSPYTDLDITNTAVDGSFSFVAKLEEIGYNTIIITADYPGKQTTRVEHSVYYVPNIDVYSRKAWDIVSQYTDLMDNLETRRDNHQIYVCQGVITSNDTTKPQRSFLNVGTEEDPIVVYVENSSKTTWQVGETYKLYGDVYGMYDSKPWLIVRYTYTVKTNK